MVPDRHRNGGTKKVHILNFGLLKNFKKMNIMTMKSERRKYKTYLFHSIIVMKKEVR